MGIGAIGKEWGLELYVENGYWKYRMGIVAIGKEWGLEL